MVNLSSCVITHHASTKEYSVDCPEAHAISALDAVLLQTSSVHNMFTVCALDRKPTDRNATLPASLFNIWDLVDVSCLH